VALGASGNDAVAAGEELAAKAVVVTPAITATLSSLRVERKIGSDRVKEKTSSPYCGLASLLKKKEANQGL